MNGAPDDAGVVEALTEYGDTDLDDLSDAATKAIADNGGFGWLKPPQRHVMENYWRGVLMVPERSLVVARLDGVICGSAQLVRTPRNNEAQAFAAQLTTHFVAPWARRRGLGRRLVEAVEQAARDAGVVVLNLDVRATQAQAIALYERLGFARWGTHPAYARVDGAIVPGHYYLKRLDDPRGRDAPTGPGPEAATP